MLGRVQQRQTDPIQLFPDAFRDRRGLETRDGILRRLWIATTGMAEL